MFKILFKTFIQATFLCCLCACSKSEDVKFKDNIEVLVLFSPEGFSNMSYNDVILQAIEKSAQIYNFEYSFYVPAVNYDDELKYGIEKYREWRDKPLDDNIKKSLLIVASSLYKRVLDHEQYPSDERKEILIFELQEEVPYAYSFFISMYGASYYTGKYTASILDSVNFKAILANNFTPELEQSASAFEHAIKNIPTATLNRFYISTDSIVNGFDDQRYAYQFCFDIEAQNPSPYNVYIPLAGLSNMGIYRFARTNSRMAIGIDYNLSEYSVLLPLSIVKRIDLAINDFMCLWLNNKDIPKHKSYFFDSDKIEVSYYDSAYISNEIHEELKNEAILKEKEYYETITKQN